VKKKIDCQVFEDQLGALVNGDLPADGVEQLRLHSESCPDCAMQLKVHEHLAAPSLEELEARVPSSLVASVWPRVEGTLEGRTRTARPTPETASRRRSLFSAWQVPVMAAAILILLLGSGFLFAELRKVQARERVLAEQILDQREWLAELELRTSLDDVSRTASLTGRTNWIRALSREERITVRELREMLRSLPGNPTLLSATEVRALQRRTGRWTPMPWGEALRGFQGETGIRAQDLLAALETMDLHPEINLPTARIVDLLN
jgi:hypothetical protein